jgi:predicted PurR-regulated permease PerM
MTDEAALNATRKIVRYSLLASLFLILVLAFVVFRPFILTFAVAASASLLLAPLHDRLTRSLGGRHSLAAALLVVLCTVIILVPVLSYGMLLVQQASGFVEWIGPRLEPEALDRLWRETLPARFPLLMSALRSIGLGVMPSAAALARLTSAAQGLVQAVVAGVATAALDLLIFLMMVFFLLRDAPLLREQLRGVSPFTRGQEAEMLDHLTRTVRGVLQAMLLVPLAQGVVALLGFLALGLPAPFLWSAMVVLAALIPILGSPLAWIPAGLYLFSISPPRGIALLAFGVLVISMIDNILKPLILKGAAQVHMLLGFLSILGGLYAFGFKGLIVGPVVLSLVMSAFRIYRQDILRWRHEVGTGRTGAFPVMTAAEEQSRTALL